MPDAAPEQLHSWEYPHWPRVEADVPLASSDTVTVLAEASRWGGGFIHVRWQEDGGDYHQAWVPKGNVRRLTASDWDIIEHHQTPEHLRRIRWLDRLPGFLPE